jgi:hypothetical protein
MAIRKTMSKKTDPPAKKTTSATGPYKAGMKTDKSTGVRKMTKPAAPKEKGGSQFLPKGIPAGNKKKLPPSKTKPRSVASGPNWMERNLLPRDKSGNISKGILGDFGQDDLFQKSYNKR